MSKKKRSSQSKRTLTRPHDIERWLEQAGQHLLATLKACSERSAGASLAAWR